MKRKFSMFLNIAMLALSVCALAFGVYSAKQASLNVTGSIGFSAHNCDVDITASIYGHAKDDDSLGEPVLQANKVLLNDGNPLQITGADKTLSFGSRYFSDMGESGEVEPIILELTITNKSKFEVLLEDLTTVASNASYTAVCTNPLHVLYTDEDKTTTLQYILRPAKVDGEYQNISTPVDVSLSMKFSKLNTDIPEAGFSYNEETRTITGVPSYDQTGSDLIVIPSKFSDNETTFTMLENYDEGLDENIHLENINDYRKVVILRGITSLVSAFIGCGSLTSVAIPSNVNNLFCTFSDCTSLTSITIPNNLDIMSESAFSGCSSLISITIPSSVESVDYGVFWGCSSLTSITFLEGLTSIGYSAFSGCSSLTSITIPSGLTSIGGSAFSGCSSLTSISIPSGLTSIDGSAFSGCSNLTSIVVDSENAKYDSRNNCNAIIETDTNTLIAGCSSTVIPNTVTSIGDCAFSGCNTLTSIIIPSSVNSIGDYAFSGCNTLTSIIIPSSVTSIASRAFKGCTGLTSITFGENSQLISIGMDAFSGCNTLTSIIIPSSVTSIARRAFKGCTNLNSVVFADTTKTWTVKYDSTVKNSSVNVSDAATNATNFTVRYFDSNWTKNS